MAPDRVTWCGIYRVLCLEVSQIKALIDADVIKYQIASVCQTQMYIDKDGFACSLKQNSERYIDIIYLADDHLDRVKDITISTSFRKKADVMSDRDITEGEIVLDDIDKCLHSVKLTVEEILEGTGCDECTLYLTRGENFRYQVYPEYKAGRLPKPLLVPKIEEYMQSKWNCVVSEEIEADDALGIDQCTSLRNDEKTVLVSIDKDLDMIPGWHYNPDKGTMYHMSPDQSMSCFWHQVLTGDSVDNILGCGKRVPLVYKSGPKEGQEYTKRVGVGPGEAKETLHDVELKDMREVCLNKYLEKGFDEDYFRMNCKLLWVLRKPLKETYRDEEETSPDRGHG